MAMAFVASHTWNAKGVAAGTVVSLDLSVGVSPTVGNLVVIFVAQNSNAQPSTPPAGWSSGGGANLSTTVARGFIFFYKIWAAGDSTTWTCARASGVAWIAEAIEVSGAEMVANGISGQTNTAALTQLTPTVTPTSAVERFAVCGFMNGAADTWSGATITTSGAMTKAQDQAQSPISASLFYLDIASTTGTYAATGTATPTSAVGGGAIILFQPKVSTARSGAATQAQVGGIGTLIHGYAKAGAATQAQAGDASAGTVHPRSGAATQAQSGSASAPVARARSGAATQAQAGALAEAAAHLRTGSATQAQAGAVTRTAAHLRTGDATQAQAGALAISHPRSGAATQAQAGAIAEATTHPRSGAATQAQAGAIAEIATHVRSGSATQAQAGAVVRAVTRLRTGSATQAQAGTAVKGAAQTRSGDAAQAQAGSLASASAHPRSGFATQAQTAALGSNIAAHPRTAAATQAQAGSITRAATRLRTVAATQAQVAGVVKGAAQALSGNATQAQVASLTRVLHYTRAADALQAQVGALGPRAISRNAAAAQQAQFAATRLGAPPVIAEATQAQVGALAWNRAVQQAAGASQEQVAAILTSLVRDRQLNATQAQVAEILFIVHRVIAGTVHAWVGQRYTVHSAIDIIPYVVHLNVALAVPIIPYTAHLAVEPLASARVVVTVGGIPMSEIPPGNVARITCWIADPNGNPIAPSTLVCTVYDAKGGVTHPSITTEIDGTTNHADVPIPFGCPGRWHFGMAATGAVIAAAEGSFVVPVSAFD